MKIDELGMYYIKSEVDDKEDILDNECSKCGEEFEGDEKVYMSQQFTETNYNHKEYCRTCMRSMKVADNL